MAGKRTALFVTFFALITLGFFRTQSEARVESMEEVAPGVWFREGDLKGKGHCNNVVIEMKDYLIVVDANFPSGAQAVLADIRRVSKKPVRYVFDTHHHGDHAYGNPIWTKHGATTLAHVNVIEEMKRYEPKRWQAEQRADVKALKLSAPQPPRQTFQQSPFVLDDGNRRVEFHHFGWAHTRGDGFVYLPKERILCTGDAATNGPYNYTGDAHLANWPLVLGQAAKLDVAKVLPGHGPAGGSEILTGQMEFLLQLRRSVSRAIQQGQTLNDLVVMQEGRAVKATLTLPDSVRHWVGESLPTQIKDAFEEISAGKPHGDLPH
ncbi:MAG: MBL fold metallo-hydrolase [Bryobacteraceae bacterium]|nr:MBL fold metallo-hydrolase [Bryobacteraceae bacterium]MDW8377436.1 MBL fold metallo-hydrolase [Bryobacterales bacterium]